MKYRKKSGGTITSAELHKSTKEALAAGRSALEGKLAGRLESIGKGVQDQFKPTKVVMASRLLIPNSGYTKVMWTVTGVKPFRKKGGRKEGVIYENENLQPCLDYVRNNRLEHATISLVKETKSYSD